MSFPRLILNLTLAFLLAAGLRAQETEAASTSTEQTETVAADSVDGSATATEKVQARRAQSREQLRESFVRVLSAHPRDVARILALDPTLIANEPFLARYPEIAEFVKKNPELTRNPHYYLRDFDVTPIVPRTEFEQAAESISIFATFALVAFALAWLLRTIIEQRRWKQLSRTQSEVHNKILDRFGTTEELLQYVRSPAGTKFLEGAPISLQSEKAASNAPFGRIMWSVQVGVIVAMASLGMLLASFRLNGGSSQGFFALGMVAFCVGAGFIASAVVSMLVSKRLGLWQASDSDSSRVDDSVGVR